MGKSAMQGDSTGRKRRYMGLGWNERPMAIRIRCDFTYIIIYARKLTLLDRQLTEFARYHYQPNLAGYTMKHFTNL
jgi:hypothetical protein